MKKFSPYTDLALEIAETLTTEKTDIEGVEIATEDCELPDTNVTWVRVVNDEGAEATGKPIGNYITLESPAMKENDTELGTKVTNKDIIITINTNTIVINIKNLLLFTITYFLLFISIPHIFNIFKHQF